MVTKLVLGFLSLSLGSVLFARDHETIKEHGGFVISIDEQDSEKTFEVHYPGLVRWVEDGANQEDYNIPGCFFATGSGNQAEPSQRLMDAIEILDAGGQEALPLTSLNGTPVFADLHVKSLYVGFYKVRTKSGKSFGSLAKSIFGDKQKYAAHLNFSRGCMTLSRPPFSATH